MPSANHADCAATRPAHSGPALPSSASALLTNDGLIVCPLLCTPYSLGGPAIHALCSAGARSSRRRGASPGICSACLPAGPCQLPGRPRRPVLLPPPLLLFARLLPLLLRRPVLLLVRPLLGSGPLRPRRHLQHEELVDALLWQLCRRRGAAACLLVWV